MTSCMSSRLRVHIYINPEEGICDLVMVASEGAESAEARKRDIEWFKESFSMCGADLFIDREDREAFPEGDLYIEGRLKGYWTNTPDSGEDYDEEFDIEVIDFYESKRSLTEKRILRAIHRARWVQYLTQPARNPGIAFHCCCENDRHDCFYPPERGSFPDGVLDCPGDGWYRCKDCTRYKPGSPG